MKNGDDSDAIAAPSDTEAALARWRHSGAAQAAPVTAAIIEAMARRASAQQGEARHLVMQRIEQRIAKLPAVDTRHPDTRPEATALAQLTELVDRLGRTAGAASRPGAKPASATGRPALAPGAAPASLKAVTAFKGTWSRLRAEQRLRQAMAQVPAMAGPLNSSHLVNRCLLTMHTLSPEYLDAFMAHVDALQWLEHASGAGELTPRAEHRRPAAKQGRKA